MKYTINERIESVKLQIYSIGVWRYIFMLMYTIVIPFMNRFMTDRFAYEMFFALWLIGIIFMVLCAIIAFFDPDFNNRYFE